MHETASSTTLAPPPPAPGSERLVTSLLGAARAIEGRLEDTLAEIGLSMPKLGVLTQLVASRGPLSLSELATRQCCVRSNMTQLIDRLEGDGLVRRVPDPADRRAVRAELTGEGRARQARGAELVSALEREMVLRFSAEERALLAELLAELQDELLAKPQERVAAAGPG